MTDIRLGNPGRVPEPSRDGTRRAELAGFPRAIGRIGVALIALGCIAGAAGTVRAGTMDPFRAEARGAAPRGLDPFRRVAQALPAVPPEEEKPKLPAKPKATANPASTSTSTPVAPAAKSCQRDDDCPEGNICEHNACRKIELSTNLFPLYYHDGAFTEAAIFYWSRKANPGYTVVFPFYWHYYSPTSETFFVAPFYWHSTDSARQYDLKVVLNVSWSSEPGARSFGIWPLFYASNKFGWAVPFLLTFKVGDASVGKSFGAVLGLYWWKRSHAGAFDLGLLPPYVSSRDAAKAFTWVAPLNFYWRNADDRNLLALPLFFKNEHKTGNSIYTWIGYSRREGSEQSGTAFWLY